MNLNNAHYHHNHKTEQLDQPSPKLPHPLFAIDS